MAARLPILLQSPYYFKVSDMNTLVDKYLLLIVKLGVLLEK